MNRVIKYIGLCLLLETTLVAKEVGIAGWYGEKFHGEKTASGERFDMYANTTAHRTYPFGTLLKVTNRENGKSVEVKVNDRGPTKEERILDLSFQAAKELGMVQDGLTSVSVEVISESSKERLSSKDEDLDIKQKFRIDAYNEPSMLELVELGDEKVSRKKMEKSLSLNDSERYKETQPSKDQAINVQIASFSVEKNAKKYVDFMNDTLPIKVLESYLEGQERTVYRIVVVCESQEMANRIMDSTEFEGAYILKT